MTVLKLGKNMVDIAIGHGKLNHNVWCSNLAVAKTGNRITSVGFLDKDGNFEAYPNCGVSRYVYVLGFGDGYHDAAVSSLMRLMCFLIKDKVDTLTNRPEGEGRNSFTNGGMLSNGNIVEEAIIYTPYLSYSGPSEYQAIFTMFPNYIDPQAAHEYLRKPKLRLNNEDRRIDGVRLQEDGSPRHFTSALGKLDVRLEYEYDMQWVLPHFGPEDKQPTEAKYAVCVHFGDMMQYVNSVAQLIWLNYFNGKSYEEMTADIRQQAIDNPDYTKCGLYISGFNCKDEYFVFPAGYSGSVKLLHTKDSKRDMTITIKELADHYMYLEGRQFKEEK